MNIIMATPYYTITVPAPTWGAETTITMPMSRYDGSNGSVRWWDSGTAYDTRTCKCVFNLNHTDAAALTDFLSNSIKGRGANILMGFDETPAGFAPFGWDLGDETTFITRLLSVNTSGQKHSPWKWWTVEAEFVMASATTPYYITDGKKEGSLSFGSVSNLRYPQTGFSPEIIQGVISLAMHGGSAQATDRGNTADKYSTEFSLLCNRNKAGELISEIVNTIRGNSFNITCAADWYPFGIDKNDSGAIACRLFDNKIVTRQIGVDQVEINLKIVFEYQ
jgi:hypothetical protein